MLRPPSERSLKRLTLWPNTVLSCLMESKRYKGSMKLASLKNSTRDGELIVVSRDLTKAIKVPDIAKTMQWAVENWDQVRSKLEEVSQELNKGTLNDAFMFDPGALHSPLPRAYQWLDGSAYVTHVELVRKSRGAVMPENFWTDPLMYQGASDSFIGPRDDIYWQAEGWGLDFESEIAVITDDVPMGVAEEDAAKHIQLIMLVNDISLRGLIPNELKKGFGFIHGKPATAFSPVAVTPDELGEAWQDCRVNLALRTQLRGELFGEPNAKTDMTFSFAKLISHAAKTRHLEAGTIVGSGTVANKNYSEVGSSCLMERRMIEKIESGEMKTPFMQPGDDVKIEMLDTKGQSIFGSIEQKVVEYK